MGDWCDLGEGTYVEDGMTYCDGSVPRRLFKCNNGSMVYQSTGCGEEPSTGRTCPPIGSCPSTPYGESCCDTVSGNKKYCGGYGLWGDGDPCTTPAANCTTTEGIKIANGNTFCSPSTGKCQKCVNGVMTSADPISLDCSYFGTSIKNGEYYCSPGREYKIGCRSGMWFQSGVPCDSSVDPDIPDADDCKTSYGQTVLDDTTYCNTTTLQEQRCTNGVLKNTGNACPGITPTMSVTPATGTAPLTVKFTLSAPGAASQYLYFDDGESSIGKSIITSVSHVYKNEGIYTASFYYLDSKGGRSSTITKTITVSKGIVKPTDPIVPTATACDGMDRKGSFDVTCILEEDNKMYLYGVVGVIGLIILVAATR